MDSRIVYSVFELMAVRLSHYLRNIPALIPLALSDLEAQILVLLNLTQELSSLYFYLFCVMYLFFETVPLVSTG